jgi:hypothetical protein
MAIPEPGAERARFNEVRVIFEKLKNKFHLDTLSMGMSEDMDIAIAEGAGRGTNLDALRLLYIARGSLCELRTQVEVMQEAGNLAGNLHCLALDLRKPAAEVDIGEILPICVEANDAIRNLKKWMKPKRVWPTLMTGGTRSEVQYAPKGRCLIIGPFNYPLNLTLGPLVSALAAGNTVIIKPSELTPHLSGMITQLVGELFAPDEVAIFQGDADVSKALLEMPFDHIFFTGSPMVGKYVMGAAAVPESCGSSASTGREKLTAPLESRG